MLRRLSGRSAAALAAVSLLGACTVASELFVGAADDGAAAGDGGAAGRSLDAAGLAVYLEPMQALVEGDPAVQAEVYLDAAEAVDAAPTTTNRLRLALVLAMPGHVSSSPAAAQQLLSELMAVDDALLPEERTLASIHLKEVEQRVMLDAEARRLQEAADAARERENSESEQRLQAALEENRRLRAALDEAQQKLEAITSIERSIRQRENATESP